MVQSILIGVLVLVIVGVLIFSATAQRRLLKYYDKYSTKFVYCGLTGLELAKYFIYKNNLQTKISFTEKRLGDFYSPKYDAIVLSKQTASTSNIASIAIASHELGHAVQKQQKMFLFRLSNFLRLFFYIGSFLVAPAIVAGIVFLFLPNKLSIGLTILIVCLSFIVFSYITKILDVPIEFNASKIAYNFLKENNILDKTELKQVKKMLKVAANTYIASLFSGLLKLFK